MAIEFRCTRCQKLLRTPDGTSGKEARCPECGATVRIPELASVGQSLSETVGYIPAADNPYATAGQHAHAAPGGADEDPLVPTHIEVGDVLARTWEIFKERWLPCAAATWGAPLFVVAASLPLVAIYVLVGLANQDDPLPWVFGGIGLGVAIAIISVLITLGLHAFMLKIARGEPATAADLFAETSLIVPGLMATVLVSLAVMAGFAMLIVPGVIVALMFSQCLNVMVDRQVGMIDALRLSMRVTDGNKTTLFLLGLLMAAVNSIGGSLTCGLFSIAFAPFASLLGAVAYLTMSGQKTARQPALERERSLGSAP